MPASSARRRLFGAVAITMLSILLAAPSVASAQTPRVQTLAASLHDRGPGAEGTLVVSAVLAKGTTLPTSVDIPVPPGAKPTWVGEVLGGDVSADPTAKYTVKGGKDGDTVTVQLTKSLTAQVEVVAPAVANTPDGRREVGTTLRVPYAVGEALVVLRAPADAKSLKYTPGMAPTQAEEGFAYYTLKRATPKAGSALKASVSYTGGTFPTGAASGAGASAQGAAPANDAADQQQGLVGLAVIGAAVAAFAVFALLRRKKALSDDEAPSEKATGTTGPKRTEPSPTKGSAKPKLLLLGIAVAVLAGAVWLSVSAVKPPLKAGEYTQEGGVQRLSIDTSSGDFKPGDFKVKAGVPVELQFGPGKGCTARITFPSLNVDQDLTSGAVVKLPALKAGSYSYNCGSGSQSGTLIAE